MKKVIKKLRLDNRGIGVVEIILILVVLIGLVLIFKNQIGAIINDAFEAITGGSETIIGE